jgi:hypothetical protein
MIAKDLSPEMGAKSFAIMVETMVYYRDTGLVGLVG